MALAPSGAEEGFLRATAATLDRISPNLELPLPRILSRDITKPTDSESDEVPGSCSEVGQLHTCKLHRVFRSRILHF